jgi:hypothetical protein
MEARFWLEFIHKIQGPLTLFIYSLTTISSFPIAGYRLDYIVYMIGVKMNILGWQQKDIGPRTKAMEEHNLLFPVLSLVCENPAKVTDEPTDSVMTCRKSAKITSSSTMISVYDVQPFILLSRHTHTHNDFAGKRKNRKYK